MSNFFVRRSFQWLCGLCVLISSSWLHAQTGTPLVDRPNIVLINLDDADADLLRPAMLQSYYPNIRSMAAQGLRFTNMHATTPFCSPSRAALMRGQYAFETGVKINDPESITSNGFAGGYGEFVARGHDQAELGVWLKNAGYRTMHVGKYHHHNFDNRVPPGWDDFRVTLGAKYTSTFRFTNQFEASGSFYRTEDDDYITRIEGNDAVELIDNRSNSNQPFFLYVAPIAPHAAQSFVPEDIVEPQYENFAQGLTIPNTPDYFEEDVSDKPRHLRFQFPDSFRNFHQREFISRVRAIKSVDDLVGRIYDALEDSGKAENTIVMLTSDNGYQLGHHNLHNKTDPYHRTSNVPLIVAGPGIDAGNTASHLLAHIDLCPTILELAGAQIPDIVSAKSFSPLLFNPDNFAQSSWQDGIMIENWSKKPNFQSLVVGSYVAYRMHHEIFVSWANGQYEYYDLIEDPFQLNNRYEDLPTSEVQEFKRKIRRFRTNRIEPITTIDQIYADTFQTRNIKVRGYAEDDAGVFGTLVTMRSLTTDRFWNGESWQDDWFGHFVNARNHNQPISLWTFRTRVTTETESGFDRLLFTYRSLDSDGQLPHVVNFHVNNVDGKSPFARFDDYGQNQPRLTNPVELRGAQFDAFDFDRSILTIRNVDTGRYFDGSGFRPSRFDLPVNNNNSAGTAWIRSLNLPLGRYVAGIRAIDVAGNVQHPATLLRFRVVE